MLQTLDFPFTAGIDESSDSKVLPMPRLTRATNLYFDTDGRVSKRPGTARLAAASTGPLGPKRLAVFGDELLAFDDSSVWSYSETSDSLQEIEDTIAATLEKKTHMAAYGSHDVVSVGCAATDDFIVHAWGTKKTGASSNEYHMHVVVLDRTTGSAGSPATSVPNVSNGTYEMGPGVDHLKVVAAGDEVFVLWGATVSSSATYIKMLKVTASTDGPWSVSAVTDLVTDADQSAVNWFDADAHTGDNWALAYVSTTAGTIKTRRYSGDTLQATGTVPYSTGEPHVGIVGGLDTEADKLQVIVQELHATTAASSKITWHTMGEDLVIDHSPAQTGVFAHREAICVGKFDFNSTSVALINEGDNNSATCAIWVKGITSATAAEDTSEDLHDIEPASRLFGDGTRTYFIARLFSSQANSHNSLVSIAKSSGVEELSRTECSFNWGQAANVASTYASSFASLGSSEYEFGVMSVLRSSDPSLLGDPTVSTQVVDQIAADAFRFKIGATDQFQAVELGGSLYTAGGMVAQYDGRRLTELGFYGYPDLDTDDFVVSTGGSIDDGTYTYAVVYEWNDSRGARHQSAAKLVSVTVASGSNTGKVTITIPGIRETRKEWRVSSDTFFQTDGRPVSAAIYRTSGSADGGTILYRLEGPGVPSFEDLARSDGFSFTFVDTFRTNAIELTAREILYTSANGANELQNFPPPPSKVLVAHQDRLFGIDAADPTTMWYTKFARPGIGLAWNPSLVIKFQETITAAASMDGNLYAFSRGSIYTVIERPADNTGLSTSYDAPQRLSGEIGCIEPRSVVTCPSGIFFQSASGLFVAPRGGGTPVYVGKNVENTLRDYPIVVAALHVPIQNQVRFACVTAEGPGGVGRILVYDYDSGAWFVWDYGEIPMSSLVLHRDKMAIGIPSAESHVIWREDGGFDDPSGYIATQLETGDIRLSGLAGYQAVQYANLLGTRLGSCDVTVEESIDSGSTWETSSSWSLDTAEPDLKRRHTVRRRKSGQHRFRITESSSGTVDTQGFAMNGMTLEVKRMRRADRLAGGKR